MLIHEWDRHAILAEVRRRGSTLAEIGRAVGLKRPSMTWALIAPHPRANRAIADFLGVSLCELWPQWFDEDGKLISREPLRAARRLDAITRGSHPARPGKRAA